MFSFLVHGSNCCHACHGTCRADAREQIGRAAGGAFGSLSAFTWTVTVTTLASTASTATTAATAAFAVCACFTTFGCSSRGASFSG
jgi:hypothetical protein